MANYYKKLTKNKGIEIEFLWEKQFTNYFNFCISWNKRIDHPGFKIIIDLFKFNFSMNIYDGRHWNYHEDRYYLPEEKEEEYEKHITFINEL